MDEKDYIIGIHSIAEALANSARAQFFLHATEEGFKALKGLNPSVKNQVNSIQSKIYPPHDFQIQAKKMIEQKGHTYSRIPSGLLLETSPQTVYNSRWLIDQAKASDKIKIISLDQVTDIHNAGAIMRTAAFYEVFAVVLSSKNTFSLSPHFYRTSSGAVEHVKIVRTSNLSRLMADLINVGVSCVGLAETGEDTKPAAIPREKINLVLGSEEFGISHAVLRQLKDKVALSGPGPIKTLNVSVAAAVAMERFF